MMALAVIQMESRRRSGVSELASTLLGAFGFVALRGAAIAIQLTACVPIANALRIEPGATADSLAFVVSGIQEGGRLGGDPAVSIYGLSVIACGTERSMWTVASNGTRSMPRRIMYGQILAGFPVRTGPFPLTAGCYDALMTGAHALRFDVEEDRSIRVRGTARQGGGLE